jgi:hypothetical protein
MYQLSTLPPLKKTRRGVLRTDATYETHGTYATGLIGPIRSTPACVLSAPSSLDRDHDFPEVRTAFQMPKGIR